MKILIGCDKLSSVDKIYFDFKRAGLPDSAEICVFSVADVFVPPGYQKARGKRNLDQAYFSLIDKEVANAQKLADRMGSKLMSKFSHWRVHSYAVGGSPSQEILKKAKEWKADLIVVGSHGRPGVGEFFFGSVASNVMAGSSCSVRVVRKGSPEADSPSRIIVAADGSPQNEAMINQIAGRHWKEGSSAHLITAVDMVVNPMLISDSISFDPFIYPLIIPEGLNVKKQWRSGKSSKPVDWIKKMHAEYQSRLEKAGLIVSSLVKEGDPKVMITKEAARWGADCIYVAAYGHSKMERLLMGSVSVAVAARARCSVEVIRKNHQ